ncbi:MAG: type II toxin-antitoxin system RelE/ParE family toxin [Acidimicrobiaceae bacterium]|nr:type II toxin-antitoxin system RelE/ParE family toxin [Acidimicrobiaceae bacterium]MDE0606652.1 type II toxin-antitoxin system RelE/ParE family toxin [Acidimicrobiaceae bacterium]
MAQLTRRAKKDLDDLPAVLATKATGIIRRIDNEPHMGKNLVGPLRGKRSVRLGRSHRIIYTATDGKVIVLTISHRRDAYR